MRVGECTGLRWEDIDLEKGIITVSHTLVYFDHNDKLDAKGKKCYFSINTPKKKLAEGAYKGKEVPGI